MKKHQNVCWNTRRWQSFLQTFWGVLDADNEQLQVCYTGWFSNELDFSKQFDTKFELIDWRLLPRGFKTTIWCWFPLFLDEFNKFEKHTYLFHKDNFIFMILKGNEFRLRGGSDAFITSLLKTLARWQVQHLIFRALVSRQVTCWMEECTSVIDVAIFTQHSRSTHGTEYLTKRKFEAWHVCFSSRFSRIYFTPLTTIKSAPICSTRALMDETIAIFSTNEETK